MKYSPHLVFVLLLLAGCARFGFEPVAAGEGGLSGDAAMPDGPDGADAGIEGLDLASDSPSVADLTADSPSVADLTLDSSPAEDLALDSSPAEDLALDSSPAEDLTLDSSPAMDVMPAPDLAPGVDAIMVAGCVAVVDTVTQPLGGTSQCVDIEGNLIAVGASDTPTDGVTFYTHDGSALTQRGSFATHTGPGALETFSNDVLGVDVRGTTAYLATYYGGVVALDISDVDAPAFIAGLPLGGESWGVQASGTHLFVANTAGGLLVLQLQGATLVQVGALPLTGSPHDVHIVGDTVFVAAYTHVHQVDISTPTAPTLSRSVDGFTQAYELWSADGRYVYIAEKVGREVVALDMNAAAGSERTTSFALATAARCIAGAGNLLVVGTDDHLLSYDLSDPADPIALGGPVMSSSVFEVAVAGGLVVAGLREGFVHLGDVAACP